jgi:predicted Zn-dependent protease
MILTEARAQQILQKVIAYARGHGAVALASLSGSHQGNTRFAVNEITSSSEIDRHTLAVSVQLGKRVASATTNQLDDRSLQDVTARAVRLAKLAPENPEAMPPLGKQVYKPARNASDAATVAMTPEARAKAIGAALGAAGNDTVIAGYFEHGVRFDALASTAGLASYHAWTSTHLTCTARTQDGTGSGWAGGASNRVGDLDAGALAKIAVDKARSSAKPTKLDPGRYTVVLEPAAVADLFGWLVGGALDARRADEGRSFFSKPGAGTRVGEKLFPEAITVRSDPTDAQLATRPFDGEGFPLLRTTWIDKGVVKGLVYNRYWAQKQGKPATGQPSGWILEGGKATRDELIKGVKRGVLITRFWYLRSLDPQTILVTGLTRDGTFLIENGAVTRPVTNFRFNESPVQMLGRCDAMTPPVIAGRMRVPAIRTHDFNLASISEAV